MKTISFEDPYGTWKNYEVGRRQSELGEVIDDIILDGDTVVITFGMTFKVYRVTSYEYTECHATKNPYMYKGRQKEGL
jgi:hypothetical protein